MQTRELAEALGGVGITAERAGVALREMAAAISDVLAESFRTTMLRVLLPWRLRWPLSVVATMAQNDRDTLDALDWLARRFPVLVRECWR